MFTGTLPSVGHSKAGEDPSTSGMIDTSTGDYADGEWYYIKTLGVESQTIPVLEYAGSAWGIYAYIPGTIGHTGIFGRSIMTLITTTEDHLYNAWENAGTSPIAYYDGYNIYLYFVKGTYLAGLFPNNYRLGMSIDNPAPNTFAYSLTTNNLQTYEIGHAILTM
jgi:hypothetical protein